MDKGEARAEAQRRLIRQIGILVAVLACVCGVVVIGVVVLFAVGMNQWGSNK
jgi:hypothetical protein